jgi:hypothetical protein
MTNEELTARVLAFEAALAAVTKEVSDLRADTGGAVQRLHLTQIAER